MNCEAFVASIREDVVVVTIRGEVVVVIMRGEVVVSVAIDVVISVYSNVVNPKGFSVAVKSVVDESLVIIALLRCTCFVWLGVWEIHIAFTLYSDNKTPRTDNILLTPDPMQKMLDLLTCIGYMVMSMITVAIQALAVYLFLKPWSKKKTQDHLL